MFKKLFKGIALLNAINSALEKEFSTVDTTAKDYMGLSVELIEIVRDVLGFKVPKFVDAMKLAELLRAVFNFFVP